MDGWDMDGREERKVSETEKRDGLRRLYEVQCHLAFVAEYMLDHGDEHLAQCARTAVMQTARAREFFEANARTGEERS